MAQAQLKESLSVPASKLFSVITKYEDYPSFVEGCSRVEVTRGESGRARVVYFVNMIKEISYTLDHISDEATAEMSWSLVQSDFLKKNLGGWKIKPKGDSNCEVEYSVDIDFKFPVPGMILSRLVKSNLPSMIRNFEKRAKQLN